MNTAGLELRPLSVRPNGAAGMTGSVRPLPVTTLATVGLAILVYLVPVLQPLLVLGRDAVAAGQLWRIATGNLVHFSVSHLVYDLIAVGMTGAMLERDGHRLSGVVVASSIAIGLAVLLFAPGVAIYGGLSGVAYTLVVLATLHRLSATARERAVAATVLVLAAVKLGWEIRSGAFLFVGGSSAGFVPVPLTHLTGALVGVAAFFCQRARSGVSTRSWKSKLKSVSGETASIRAPSTPPAGSSAKVT